MKKEINQKILEINHVIVNHIEKSKYLTLSLMTGLPGILSYLSYSNATYNDSVSSTLNDLIQNGVKEFIIF
tara:strand:+ start:1953 stop:2165 length:213 start_codon:yes stop_codon:yes gene_type:complete